MKRLVASAALFVLFVAGCTSVRLGLDHDGSFDFSRFKTFSFVPEEETERVGETQENPLMGSRIRTAIDSVLSERGYLQTTPDEADFLVGYHLSIEKKLDVNTVSAGIGYGGYNRWGSVGFQTRVSQYDEGTIVIDIADGETERLVWRGSGSRRIKPIRDPEKTTNLVNRAVSEILAQFPPKK